MSIRYADVVVDLQHGDTGKGKVTNQLARNESYTHVVRYGGGHNAGHTIYHEGKKVVTHAIPCGVLHGIKSIIGSGCVVNPKMFLDEVQELESLGFATKDLVFIANNAHVITDAHLAEDAKDVSVGTTKRGNGPAYRDKYGRTGIRAENVPELQPYLVDLYEEFHHNKRGFNSGILFEGAQGFGLDIDWGDYPYVTSSHCTAGGATLNGVPPSAIRTVWGVAKMYETYVGAKKFQPEDPVFDRIREIGAEYGATTGRPRQVNWLNVRELYKAAEINGVRNLIINKVDVLEQIGVFKLYDGKLVEFKSLSDMKIYLHEAMPPCVKYMRFSDNPEEI